MELSLVVYTQDRKWPIKAIAFNYCFTNYLDVEMKRCVADVTSWNFDGRLHHHNCHKFAMRDHNNLFKKMKYLKKLIFFQNTLQNLFWIVQNFH